MPSTKTEETEELLTLPVGHPEAGYVGPDLSFTDGVGTLPPEEQEARDEAQAARDEEVEAVAQHEHEVATAEREAELNPPEPEPQTTGKQKAQPIEKSDS